MSAAAAALVLLPLSSWPMWGRRRRKRRDEKGKGTTERGKKRTHAKKEKKKKKRHRGQGHMIKRKRIQPSDGDILTKNIMLGSGLANPLPGSAAGKSI